MSVVATVTACVAAAILGGASVAQRRGMSGAAAQPTRPLLSTLVGSGWWWAGTLASLGGLALQVLALTLGSIIVVQTALISSIVWTTLAEWALLDRRPTTRSWAGIGLTAGGLATTLITLDPAPGPSNATPTPFAVLALGGGASVVMLLAVGVAHIRAARGAAGGGSALLLALATGIGYGITAVQFKSVGVQLAAGASAVLTHPALYVALLLGPAAVVLSQLALQRGRLVVAVVSLILVVDPVIGLLAGVVWFGEQVASSPAALVAAAAGIAALVGGLALIQTAQHSAGEHSAGSAAPTQPCAIPPVGAGDRSRAVSPPPRGDEEPSPHLTATRFVLDGCPVHLVIHDRAGEWRVLGEQVFHQVDERPTEWTTLVGLDPSLASLPPLPHGTLAHRPTRGGSWVVVPG